MQTTSTVFQKVSQSTTIHGLCKGVGQLRSAVNPVRFDSRLQVVLDDQSFDQGSMIMDLRSGVLGDHVKKRLTINYSYAWRCTFPYSFGILPWCLWIEQRFQQPGCWQLLCLFSLRTKLMGWHVHFVVEKHFRESLR